MLMNLVQGEDDRATNYFGNFVVCLQLERLTEMGAINKRYQRGGEKLARGGWCLCDVREESVLGHVLSLRVRPLTFCYNFLLVGSSRLVPEAQATVMSCR